MNADKTDEQGTLLSLRDTAAALGLRPATVKQYILRGRLAAVRVPCVHGDVELTHLRQFGLTHLFQVARSWRAPSSLVDADRGLCHLV